jgi:hypothetical protein
MALTGVYNCIYSVVEVERFWEVWDIFRGLLFLRSSNKEVMLVTTLWRVWGVCRVRARCLLAALEDLPWVTIKVLLSLEEDGSVEEEVVRDLRMGLVWLLLVPSGFEPDEAGRPLDGLPELCAGDKCKESERAKGLGEGEQKEEGAIRLWRSREVERVTPDEDTYDSVQSRDPLGEKDSLPGCRLGEKPRKDESDIATIMRIMLRRKVFESNPKRGRREAAARALSRL